MIAAATDHALGDPESPYLLTHEAARLLRFTSPHLFHKWAKRNRVPVLRRGRTLLYERRVLEAFLSQKRWTTVRTHEHKVAEPRAIGNATSGESSGGVR